MTWRCRGATLLTVGRGDPTCPIFRTDPSPTFTEVMTGARTASSGGPDASHARTPSGEGVTASGRRTHVMRDRGIGRTTATRVALYRRRAISMPRTMSQSMPSLRKLAVAQAFILLVALGAPIAALAAVNSVSPGSLAQGATSQPVTITGSGFAGGCSTYSVTFSGSGVSAAGVARSSNTAMTANVTVTAAAAVGLRDVTVSGNGGCSSFSFLGTDAFTVKVGAGAAAKLAITSISPQSPTAGMAFSVVVQSQDAAGTPANVTSRTAVSLSLNTGSGTLGGPLAGSIAKGANAVTISGVTYSKAETGVRLTATRTSGMSPLASGSSAAFTVVAGTFTKLQVLVPGEIAAPGTTSGKTGTPTTQMVGSPFTVTVNAVDPNWNVATSTDVVGITSSDPAATLPASAALVGGTRTFSVTLNTVGGRTVTAADLNNGSKAANTSPAITVISPAAISLTRSRGMVTYGETDTFSVQFGTGGANRSFVLEYTSVGVPWTTIATLTTNAAGFASFLYVPTRTGYVRARFPGATDLGAATSTVYIVGVRQTVSTLSPHHATTRTIAAGTSITFATTVRPTRADLAPTTVTFRFYQKVSGAWVLKVERGVVTGSSGVASATFRFGSKGAWYVRAYAPRTPYNSISRFTAAEYYVVQ